ncbi:MAG: ATP-binding cassette domain-containing protein [Clostridia bacterium]|nr:ATP-binding cassette domain-containing protein [Clostridia bacterium]
MENIVIDVCDLKKVYGEQTVLQDIDIGFEEGSCTGIVGNNGSGKTVLFKCICGFVKPTEGYVKVNGKIIGKEVDFIEDAGIIIETPGFINSLSGLKNLEMLAALNDKIGREEIIATLETVGLREAMNKKVKNYSLGMRQRLGIAQAIMERPGILILDEPFNGLDKIGVVEMRGIIKDMNKDGTTIIISSHNNEDIKELCGRVIELDGGMIKNDTQYK